MDYRAVFQEAATPLLLLDSRHRVVEQNRCAIERLGDVQGETITLGDGQVTLGDKLTIVRTQKLEDHVLVTVLDIQRAGNERADPLKLGAYQR
ncbi:MAG TPA: hypothetical protein VGC41_26370, partial [Kofleriaceae bacterium]